MAALLNPAQIYTASDKYATVAAWTALTAYAAGNLVRQRATPSVGNERVFVCIVAGTTLASEPSWTLTKGANTAEAAGPTWQECTGQPPVNGDVTNTLGWTASAKANSVVLGQIIKDDAAANYQICTTAGTCGSGSQPSFSSTAGTTTADNTVTWTSLGVVGNFAGWSAPHARLANAMASTWTTINGATYYVLSTHAETQGAALSLSAISNPNTPAVVTSVSNSTMPPTAYLAGASISTTGANNITVGGSTGFLYMRGITFNAGSGANITSLTIGNGSTSAIILENCGLNNTGTSGSSSNAALAFGIAGGIKTALLRLINCTITFANAAHYIGGNASLANGEMIGGSIAATGTVPTTLFSAGVVGSPKQFYMTCRGVDMSAVTGILLDTTNASDGLLKLINCKLGAAVAMTNGNIAQGTCNLSLRNCDSGSLNYRFYESGYNYSIQHETTTIRTGGASDGTTAISWKNITGANSVTTIPLRSPPIEIWNDTTGSSKTATVEIAGASTLTNADIWMELEYLGNASFPISTITTNRVADILTTPSNVTTSAAGWGGSPAVTQKLQITFTPQMKGIVSARIYLAKPSTTVYIDPLITIT